jgi:hypothetical protein
MRNNLEAIVEMLDTIAGTLNSHTEQISNANAVSQAAFTMATTAIGTLKARGLLPDDVTSVLHEALADLEASAGSDPSTRKFLASAQSMLALSPGSPPSEQP